MNNSVIGYETYITTKYDTFDRIAHKEYGNAFLASLIIEHNPRYVDVLIFDSGITLTLPIVEQSEAEDTLPPWRIENESGI